MTADFWCQFFDAVATRHLSPVGFATRCSDWHDEDYFLAAMGEFGELCNQVKKWRRGDAPLSDLTDALSSEIADTITYVVLLMLEFGVTADQFSRQQAHWAPLFISICAEEPMMIPGSGRRYEIQDCTTLVSREFGKIAQRIHVGKHHNVARGQMVGDVTWYATVIVSYLLLLCDILSISPFCALVRKFNVVSGRIGYPFTMLSTGAIEVDMISSTPVLGAIDVDPISSIPVLPKH